MTNGISSADVAAFYDAQLEHMRGYESGNGRLARINNRLSRLILPNTTVLDVGCGTGITSRHMAECGADVTAIDVSPKLIEYAKSKSNGYKITYLIGETENLDINRAFDLIVMADVFEHILRNRIFYTMQRLLKYHSNKETRIYLNIPNYSFLAFMQQDYPEKLQVVDEAWRMDDVLSIFANWNFWPITMEMYGLDCGCQYNEYLFAHGDWFNSFYRQHMSRIYEKGVCNG